MKDKKKSRRILVVAPDRATAGHLARVLAQRVDGKVDAVTSKEPAKLRRFLSSEKSDPICAVLVPSDEQGPSQIDLVRHCSKKNIPCLVWDASHGTDHRAGWLAMRLAEQSGAKTHSELEVIAQAVRLLDYFDGAPDDGVVLKGRRSCVVGARITDTLQAEGIKIKRSVRARPNTGLLSLGDDGLITLAVAGKAPLELDAFETTFSAMALLVSKEATGAIDKEPKFEIQREGVSFIVKPPPRVLSEVTSKRLLACYGVGLPREQLCVSQSEAVRVAAGLRSPVTLKLVRPEFSSRHHPEAVSRDVRGQAAVKREFNRLMLFSERLAPPKALGVLVAEQATPQVAIRVRLDNHAHFGPLLLLGQQLAEFADGPGGAVPIPCSYSDVRIAVNRTIGDVAAGIASPLCAQVYRLALCAADLAARIDRLEVEPLVVTKNDDGFEALAADATIGIAEEFDFSTPA